MARKTKAEAEQTRQNIICAARRVFYRCGVTKSTLDSIAAEAGVTRGAVYWHFKDKTELFFAMRAQALLPLIDHGDEAMLDAAIADPLDAIERALQQMIADMKANPVASEVFRIASLRCEYVDELSPIIEEFKKSHAKRVNTLTTAYRRAKKLGTLRDGCDPRIMALDTMCFFEGVLRRIAVEADAGPVTDHVRALIRAHVALRRK